MTSAIRDFADWSMYPFRLMGQTVDMMTKTVLGVQTGFGGSPRSQNGGDVHSSPSTSTSTSTYQSRSGEKTEPAESSGSRWKDSSSQSSSGDDKNLGGDDIKLVRSYVAFTKPGQEKTSEERTELVTWDTDEETFAGTIVGRYLRDNPAIDDHDMRYLKPHIEVIDRWPKEAEETETITRRVEIHEKRTNQ